MIRDRNIADDAQIQLHKLQAMGFAGPVTGEVFWCAGSTSQAYYWLRSRVPSDRLYTDIDTAINAMTASRGDILFVAPYYTESVTAAAGIDADKAGMSIIGIGNGESKPVITFSSTTVSDMDIDADDITIANLKFKVGIDSLNAMIDVNSDDFKMVGCEFEEGSTNLQAKTYVDINGGAANACDRAKIHYCKFLQTGSTSPVGDRAIELGEVADGVEIVGCYIDGDWDDAGIHNITGKVMTNLLIKDCIVANRATGQHAIELVSACTGFAIDNRLYGDTLGTIFDPGSLKCLGNLEVDAVDESGVASPYNAVAGYGLHTVPTADTSTNAVMRDVIGNKTDGAASGTVSTTESLMAYAKQCVGALITIDAFHDVPGADSSTATQMKHTIGHKSDATRTGAVSTTASLMRYTKQLVTGQIVIDGYHDVATANTSTNAVMRDVVGNKSDNAAAGAVSTSESLMAYTKQCVGALITIDAFHDVPGADSSTATQMKHTIGNKSDATRTGAVSTTASLMRYTKQLVTGQIVVDGYHDVPTADTSTNSQMRDVVGNKSDAAAAGTVTTTESAMAYLKQLVSDADAMHKDGANYLAVTADFTSATWNTAASHEILDVTGLVRVRIVPDVVSNVGTGASDSATISFGTDANATLFLGATTATALDADEIWQSTTPASNVSSIAKSSVIDYVINNDDIGYTIGTSATTAGSIVFHCWWEPLQSGASVSAGAGGTL